MVGGFLFIQHPNAQKGKEILTYLGPEKAKYAHLNLAENIFCGQMTLSFYNPEVVSSNHCYISGTALLNNRKELISLLNVAAENNDQYLILQCYLKFGKNCLDHLRGQFAFVIYDHENRNVFGANSRSGGTRLLYHYHNGNIIVASELKCILPFLSQRKLNKEFIIANVQSLMLEPKNSAYEGIYHLPHGYAFSFEKNEFKKWSYYVPGQTEPIKFQRKEEYYEAGNALISKVISGYLDHQLTPGIQMGGGLSSSQIAWNLRHFAGENVNAVSYILPENYEGQAIDEKQFTDILKKELQLTLHYVNEPVFPAPFDGHLEKKFWDQDSMYANPVGSDHEVVYGKLKQLGTQMTFTCGGKDFNWNGADVYSYWLFHFKWMNIIKRRRIKNAIVNSLPNSIFKLLKNDRKKKEYSILNPSLMTFKDAEKYEQRLLAALPHKFAYGIAGPDQLRKIAQWTYGMKKYMSAQERRYDMVFVNPLHDERLLDFSVAIPTDMHLQRNFGRQLLKGKVPEVIYNNRERYSYPADMGERWWNLKNNLKEHFEAIPENDEVWEYVSRKKMMEKYRFLQNDAPYVFWRNERNHFSKTIILSRFLKWEKIQN